MKTTHMIKLLLIFILLGSGNIFAQNEQLIHGHRLPRLTTEQRNQISVSNNGHASGLLIYNTDIDCVEYWSDDEWLSLCQSSLNPQVEILEANCSKVRIYGDYYMGSPLNSSHYIRMLITVIEKGNYNIVATSNNGYYFQVSGIFEQTGTFELILAGMGTPAKNQIDNITFSCNGDLIETVCHSEIDVKSLTMGYVTNCENIEVAGQYQTRKFMDNDNYVKIPIDVLQTGITNIQTDMQNGLVFSATQMLTKFGPDTLILYAKGMPKQEAPFRFTFTTDGSIKTTCSFIVNFFSTLGSFEEPACNCLAVYDERPFVENGEYWLQDCKDTGLPKTRTYCDIIGGGWTLVWSYSEKTARDVYVQSTSSGGTGNSNSMAIGGAYWNLAQDRPTNRITTSSGNDEPTNYQIDYSNFRLNRDEWLNLPASNTSQMKVRIAESPTDMNCDWALNNYAIISPRNEADNPIFSQYVNRSVPTVGKIYGKRWEMRTSGPGSGGWSEVIGNHTVGMTVYSNSSWCTHWDFYTHGGVGSSSQFEVIPDRGGADNIIAWGHIDNSFGDFSQTMPNHHFGKCSSGSGANDDYSFETKTCSPSNLVPHSFNSGEGRYVQWYVR
ncbi:MAG: hypothetical protein FWG79_04505 [Bacteroidales bacterium]|nr:hypothetical protein [Bacteroidales bacterium]